LVPRHRDNDTLSFKVLQLADLHFGEDADGTWGPEQDRKSLAAIAAVLDAEKPDLVVFSGDQVTGESFGQNNFSQYLEQRNRVLAPLEERGILWATIFGNHDDCGSPGCQPPSGPAPAPAPAPVLAAAAGAEPEITTSGNNSDGGGTSISNNSTSNSSVNMTSTALLRQNSVRPADWTGFHGRLRGAGGFATLLAASGEERSQSAAPTPEAHFVQAAFRGTEEYPVPAAASLRRMLLADDARRNLSETGAEGFFVSSSGGLSNYRLKVFASDADAAADLPSFILWFIDTGGGRLAEGLQPDLVQWLRQESGALQSRYGPLPGALYTHIPLAQYAHVDPGSEAAGCSGQSASYTSLSTTREEVTPLQDDVGLFGLLRDMHVGWVFSGHNHGIQAMEATRRRSC
jgi:hypothetical protein